MSISDVIALGVTFVLFAGILAGHIGFTAPTPILTFVQDFGLILFVFMIGMQVGIEDRKSVV